MKHFKCLRMALMITFLAVGTLYAQDAEVIYIPDTYDYQEGLRVRGKTKEECNLQTHLANNVASGAKKAYAKVVREKPTSGKYHVLEMEITGVEGAGGGSWSGPKTMQAQGKLLDQSGKRLGDFTISRYTTGGVMGGLTGTCTMFKRICKAFGKDIATFLVDPDTAVHLGD